MNSTKNKEFDQLMEKACKQIDNRRYEDALATLDRGQSLLKSEDEESGEIWAWIYEYRRYALYEAGKIDEALDECRRAIKHLGSMTLMPYLEGHKHVRGTLRAVHNMLAGVLSERAQTEEECQVALDHMNRCFATVSPIDGDDVFAQMRDTHALVLLKMSQLASNGDAYRGQLNLALKTLVNQRNPALETEPLKSAVEDESFQQYLADDPLMRLVNGPEGETFAEAIERLRNAIQLIAEIDEDIRFPIRVDPPISKGEIDKIEAAYGVPIPASVKNLLTDYGPITLGEFETTTCIRKEYFENPQKERGIVKFIDEAWGGRPEFEEYYSAKQIEYLNENYFVFGSRGIDDNCQVYYYFDRQGKIGVVFFGQDDFEGVQDHYIDPMLKGSPANMTLDQLISRQIDDLLDRLREDVGC